MDSTNKVHVGNGPPINGDDLSTKTGSFPLNDVYIDKDTGTMYVRNAVNGVAADWVSASSSPGTSYLVWDAILSQLGTDAPFMPLNANNDPGGAASVNTIGAITLGYNDVGNFSITGPVGAFPLHKTRVFLSPPNAPQLNLAVGSEEETDENVLYINTNNGASPTNNLLYFTAIRIEVSQ